eukprot:10332633-Alexandrium_andersonii.AAC.1
MPAVVCASAGLARAASSGCASGTGVHSLADFPRAGVASQSRDVLVPLRRRVWLADASPETPGRRALGRRPRARLAWVAAARAQDGAA